MGTKVCADCKQEKSIDEFYIRQESKDGRNRLCKPCDRARCAAYRETDTYKISHRKGKLKKTYGISLEDFEAMKQEQNNLCAVCGINGDLASRGTLYVDHCHATKKVRGLLCQDCNFALGLLKDKIASVENLLDYLKKNTDG